MSTSGLPDCFEWYDGIDPSCRRCRHNEACNQKQTETRPECFGELYDGEDPECEKCLDSSQCQEEALEMAAPKIRIKRAAVPVAVAEPEEEPIAVEQELESEDVFEEEPTAAAGETDGDESPYDEMSVDELREELTSRGLDATGKRSAMVERLEADDAKPVKKAAPAPKVAPKSVVVPKPAPKPAPKPVVAPKPAPKPAPVAPTPIAIKESDEAKVLRGATLAELFDVLKVGTSLVVSREDKGTWVLSLCESEAVSKSGGNGKTAAPTHKLRGDAFWQEVLTPEYYSWYYGDAGGGKPWGEMTSDEKEALASELGVEFEGSPDPKINALKMVTALLDKLGIEKYKAEYKSSAARDALKG